MIETISAVDRALDILIYLYNEGTEKGISDISKDLGMYKSTIHRSIVTLENKGFVYQNHENGKYWLGMKLFAIGKSVEDKFSFSKAAKPYTEALQKEFNETVNVSILDTSSSDNLRTIIVHKEDNAKQVLTVVPALGSSCECHCSSVGKCLLAFGKDIPYEKFTDKPLTHFTENTIKTWDDFFKCLEIVKKQGYAIEDGENEIGLTCIGAPIIDKNGVAIAAVSLSGPSHRMHEGDFEYKIMKVREAAKLISTRL
jgi:DNA-binding IclR family transcriptional regulator